MDKLKPCRGITPCSWLGRSGSTDEEPEDDPGLSARLGEDPAEKNDEITLYDEPVKGEETTAGTEQNECQLNDSRSPTSNRGKTSESEWTLNDGSDVILTNRPRRQRRPPSYLQDFRINPNEDSRSFGHDRTFSR